MKILIRVAGGLGRGGMEGAICLYCVAQELGEDELALSWVPWQH